MSSMDTHTRARKNAGTHKDRVGQKAHGTILVLFFIAVSFTHTRTRCHCDALVAISTCSLDVEFVGRRGQRNKRDSRRVSSNKATQTSCPHLHTRIAIRSRACSTHTHTHTFTTMTTFMPPLLRHTGVVCCGAAPCLQTPVRAAFLRPCQGPFEAVDCKRAGQGIDRFGSEPVHA